MEKIIKKLGYVNLIASIVSIIFGIALAINPNAVINFISAIIGTIIIIAGVAKLIQYHKNNKENHLIMSGAIMTIIFGLVIIFFTSTIIQFINVIIAIWIIFAGISNLMKVIKWKETSSKLWIMSLIFAILVIAAGLYILSSASAVTSVIGWIIAFYGILDLISNLVFMNKADKFIVIN